MSRKFHHALTGLKDTYPSPDPVRQEEFLNSLPKQKEKPKSFAPFTLRGKPFWYMFPAVATAALMLTIGIHVYQNHQPHVIPTLPEETTTTTVTALPDTTTAPQETANTSTQTQTVPVDAVQSTLQGVTATTAVIPGRQPADSVPAVQGTLTSVQTTPSMDGIPVTVPIMTTTRSGQGENSATTATQTNQTIPPVVTEPPMDDPNDWEPTSPSDDSPSVDRPPCIQTTLPPQTDPSPPGPNDVADTFTTVQPPCRYSVRGDVLEWNDFLEDGMGTDSPSCSVAWDSLVNSSQLVVSGCITEIIYTQINGVPYMQLNVEVDYVYGEATGTGTLSVYEKGGYVPLSVLNRHFDWARKRSEGMTDREIAATMVRETASSQKWPVMGDRCVCFLRAATTPGIPAGAFEYVVQTDVSRLREVIPGLYKTGNGIEITHASLVKYFGG